MLGTSIILLVTILFDKVRKSSCESSDELSDTSPNISYILLYVLVTGESKIPFSGESIGFFSCSWLLARQQKILRFTRHFCANVRPPARRHSSSQRGNKQTCAFYKHLVFSNKNSNS
uniref:Secreted protein n=1 Tax=Octopus bimaculoides TaxID=37653 RepID=A0A0L8H8M5_OCTBM